MELPGRRPRGRPKRRFMDAVKEDVQVVGVEATKNSDGDVASCLMLLQRMLVMFSSSKTSRAAANAH